MSFHYKTKLWLFNYLQRVMNVSRMWSWVCMNIVLTLCLTLRVLLVSEASPASLVGIVYCDICFNQDFSKSSHFIPGALVAVECGGDGANVNGKESRFREEVKTNRKGEFRVNLPVAVKIRECSVKMIDSNEPDCPVAATATSSSIKLKVKTPGNRVFSAGVFTFRPRKQPKQCLSGTINENSNDEFRAPTPFPSPIGKETTMNFGELADPNSFGLPLPYQFQPPSTIPLFPFQPPPDSMFIPYSQPPPDSFFTPGFQAPPDSMFPPGFQPPPDSMFIPIPLQPPPETAFDQFEPSPSMLNPQLITPPPPDFFPSRPLPPTEPQPNLIQQPPPPPSLAESVPSLPESVPPPPPFLPPFPPFPFQPSQGMPGTPPGIPSSHLKKKLSP